MDIIELILQYRKLKNENIEEKKTVLSNLFRLGSDIAEDYYYLLKECEIKLRSVDVKSIDIIHNIELRREKLHVRRQEARAMMQITYWEDNTDYKQFIYGISMILCGDNVDTHMKIADFSYGRCGHTLLDIIIRYEGIRLYYKNDEKQIIQEIQRIILRQYEAVDKGVKEMTDGYSKLIKQLRLIN